MSPRIAGEEEFQIMTELAERIDEMIPDDLDAGLAAGALGIVLGQFMGISFNPDVLLSNTLESAAAASEAIKDGSSKH